MQQSEEVVNVTRMKTKRDGKLTDLNMFMVSLKPTASIVKFAKEVRYCCNYRITLEHYVKPKSQRGTQCYNCQQYGHVSRNCGQPYRCVKCDQPHSPGQCMKMEEAPPVCSNCHGPHTVSFRGCPEAAKYLQRFNPRGKNQTTFSSVLKNSLNNRKQSNGTDQMKKSNQLNTKASVNEQKNERREQHTNSLFSLNDEIQKLFGKDLISVMSKVQDFMPNYSKVKDDKVKRIMLLELIINLTSNDASRLKNYLF